MARLPEHVYLIATEGEWPWSAVAGDHPSAADEVVAEAERRKAAGTGAVHTWQVSLADAIEIDPVPAHTVPASLQAK
jgi:hypothetical protein